LLGVAIGGFWVFGSGAAISLVDEDVRGKALAIVSGGIFIATVVALPASALIGQVSTWRVAFWIAAGMSAASILAQAAVLPRLGKGKKVTASALLTIVRIPASRVGLASASAIFFAEFAAYTYVTPMLDRRTGFSPGEATVVLLGFGLAGGLTNFAAGVTTRNHLRQTLIAAGLLIGAAAALLIVADSSKASTLAGRRADLDGVDDAGRRRRRPLAVRHRAAGLARGRVSSRRRSLQRVRLDRPACARRHRRRGRLVDLVRQLRPRRRPQGTADSRRGCGGEVSGDRVSSNLIQTMTRRSPEGA
jgi:hypothetical protein